MRFDLKSSDGSFWPNVTVSFTVGGSGNNNNNKNSGGDKNNNNNDVAGPQWKDRSVIHNKEQHTKQARHIITSNNIII